MQNTSALGEIGDADKVFAQKLVSGFFEKYERYECQELLGCVGSNWMLSTDEFRLPTESPAGMISQLPSNISDLCVILVPCPEHQIQSLADTQSAIGSLASAKRTNISTASSETKRVAFQQSDGSSHMSNSTATSQPSLFTINPTAAVQPSGIPPLDLREVYQIVRELTIGLYVMNQLPSCSLEPIFDESTATQLPPAYMDTRIGQLLVNTDYMLKGFWHGAYFPREKRLKFAERWRALFEMNSTSGRPETKRELLPEFITQGLHILFVYLFFTRVFSIAPLRFIATEIGLLRAANDLILLKFTLSKRTFR